MKLKLFIALFPALFLLSSVEARPKKRPLRKQMREARQIKQNKPARIPKLVAKVTKIGGEVTALLPSKREAILLKVGDKLFSDTSLLTKEKSFVLLEFYNQTKLTLGPQSKLVLEEIANKSPSIVRLISGHIHSQVQSDKTKNEKLYLKTQTAALGVRGTDFHVAYNQKNKITSLVTIEGNVAMAKLNIRDQLSSEKDERVKQLSAKTLRKILHSPAAIEVKEGRYSGAFPTHEQASQPVKIASSQVVALGGNEQIKVLKNDPPAQGFDDKKTGEFAPRAGGMVDFQTALYIPPPAETKLNKKENVYQFPARFGKADAETGDYIPPEGLVLDPSQGFQPTPTKAQDTKLLAAANVLNHDIQRDFLVEEPSFDETTVVFQAPPINFELAPPSPFSAIVKQDFAYDSNVTEKYYFETRDVTNATSFFFHNDTTIQYQQSLSHESSFTGKLRLKGRYYNSDSNARVYRNNFASIALPLRYSQNHQWMGKKATWSIGAEFSHLQQVLYTHKGLRPHTSDITLGGQEKIYLNDKASLDFSYSLMKYKAHRYTDKGYMHLFDMSYHRTLTQSFKLNTSLAYYRKAADTSYFTDNFYFVNNEIQVLEWVPHSTETIGLGMKWTQNKGEKETRGTEFELSPFIMHSFFISSDAQIGAFYQYTKQSSNKNSPYEFKKNIIGLRAALEF